VYENDMLEFQIIGEQFLKEMILPFCTLGSNLAGRYRLAIYGKSRPT
jgi:hypothetical protein